MEAVVDASDFDQNTALEDGPSDDEAEPEDLAPYLSARSLARCVDSIDDDVLDLAEMVEIQVESNPTSESDT